MRGIQTTILAFLSLPLLVLANPPTPPVIAPGQSKKGVNQPIVSAAAPIASTTITASVIPPTSSSEPVVTTTKTIDVSSFMTSATSSSESISSSSTPTPAGLATPTPSSSLNISAVPMASGATQGGSSNHHRVLVIVLSTVLGFVGLVLIVCSLFLIYRYRRGQSPFCHRGASPIDDDEIASWRQNGIDQKRPPPPAHLAPPRPELRPITLGSPPNWIWEASPTSIQTVMSPSSQFPDSPSFLAKAPNSRAGLTDEAVPGADPFIAPVKRQSSRLSKAPPGHIRTKSRWSSMSAKSVGSFKWQSRDRGSSDSKADGSNFSWFDPEDESVVSQLRTDHTSSSNGTSMFDGLAIGGLSPRPQPRRDGGDIYIGRAIG